jgi:AhpD family alkylhydroperoxidase
MKLPGWLARAIGGPASPQVSAANALPVYLSLSRIPGFGATLDRRLVRLAAALAAQLSGCGWCIELSAHEARLAGLSPELLARLRAYSSIEELDERERAALAVVEAVGCRRMQRCGDQVLARARQYLTEHELAELTAIAAERHCVDSFTFSHS